MRIAFASGPNCVGHPTVGTRGRGGGSNKPAHLTEVIAAAARDHILFLGLLCDHGHAPEQRLNRDLNEKRQWANSAN